MEILNKCPVCKSKNAETFFPEYFGKCVTSDFNMINDIKIDNKICKDCGLIFNGEGIRSILDTFYLKTYSLMTQNKNNKIKNFSASSIISQAEKTFLILQEMLKLPQQASLLEVGAGKGEFLSYFIKSFPKWNIKATEPSQSFHFLQELSSNIVIEKVNYFESSQTGNSVDLLVALGVLEHVENPYHMLDWGNNLLKNNGYFYIRVPNFAQNPNDLFCVDHLSKLTVPTLKSLAEAAGFEVVGIQECGVPVFMLLKKVSTPSGKFQNNYEENHKIALENTRIASGILEKIYEGFKKSRESGEGLGVFGMASAGIFAPYFYDFEASHICAYIDENQSLWGNLVNGIPVGGLSFINKYNIKHLALPINPVYTHKVIEKFRPYGINLYYF